MHNLVSIIIPTYNRAHIISETIDSILHQTYTNWECIIVDDGSTDNTSSVVFNYIKNDSRIQYHQRPINKPKGANACRNYGFEVSKGSYVLWFDSDDLMSPFKIEKHLEVFNKNKNLDFTVSKFSNFIKLGELIEENAFNSNAFNELNAENFILGNCFWGTINFICKRDLVLNNKFDESLVSGQEYNFFITVLSKNRNAKSLYIDQVLTYRRIHQNSIQNKQKKYKNQRLINKFNVYLKTYVANQKSLTENEKINFIKKILDFYISSVVVGLKPIGISDMLNLFKDDINTKQKISLFFILKSITLLKKGEVLGKKIIKKHIIV